MRALGFGALLAAIALVAVGGASADRRATHDERKAVAKVVDLPAKCAKVRVSTETAEPKWASVYWKPRPKDKCEPYARDGVAVLKLKRDKWRFVTAGSSFDCPSLYRDVPKPIARDLDIECF